MAEEKKREVGKDLLTYAQTARYLAESQIGKQDWSGMPVPVVGLRLVLEPRYKHKGLEQFRWSECYDENGTRHAFDEQQAAQASDLRWVNSWWNSKFQMTVNVFKDKQGRAEARLKPEDRLSMMIRTLEASAVWPVEAEQKALKKLATLIPEPLFESYQLTGHFPELSKRSQVTYMFRRGRPTVAIRQDEEGGLPLCALCLHPIGYYGETWAGVMCPTDEVIAHLLMMRGSEDKFWANANQHPIDHPAAGV